MHDSEVNMTVLHAFGARWGGGRGVCSQLNWTYAQNLKTKEMTVNVTFFYGYSD